MQRSKVWLPIWSLVLFLAACTATEAQLDAHATRVTAQVSAEVVATLSASGMLPTADAIRPTEIYRRTAPSIAFIETTTTTGSGILIQDSTQTKYVLTNAHILWPYKEARVVFPNGEEFLNTPLMQHDMIGDMALLGPIATDIEPLSLQDGEELAVGSPVYLVGYPGEPEIYPQPALAQGIISRLRQWPEEAISYFQVDAVITGGQSGGALLSSSGELIGMSGFIFADTFALVASTADLQQRLDDLLSATQTDNLTDRELPLAGVRNTHRYTPRSVWTNQLLILDQPAGTDIEITSRSTQDIGLILANNFGEVIESADENESGSEKLVTRLDIDGPQYLIINNYEGDNPIRVTANQPFAVFDDPDDGQDLQVGTVLKGNIDYPGDVDLYYLLLQEGEQVDIRVDSTMVDPFINIITPDQELTDLYDDDGGGGLFGLDAFLTYEAGEDGEHLLLVTDSPGADVGGYRVEIERYIE